MECLSNELLVVLDGVYNMYVMNWFVENLKKEFKGY